MIERLELGAGYRPTPGFEHNDANPGEHIEHVWPAEDILEHLPEASVSALRATHLLEHFSWRKTVDVLSVWRRALRPGGELYLEVPNLAGSIRAWREGEIGAEELVRLIYADQDYAENFHYSGFTSTLLSRRLREAGFDRIYVNDIGLVLCAWAYRPEGDA